MSVQAEQENTRNERADWLVNLALRGLITSVNALPLSPRLSAMSFVMRRLIAGPAGYRARALANLEYVWPDRSAMERRQIADASLDNAARTIIENYDVSGLRARMENVSPEGAGYAAIETAAKEGRPILFVTGHYGNFEAPRALLVNQGYTVGGLYRPMANPFFNEHYKQNMHALSDPVFAQGRAGTIGLIRHLKTGGMATLLYDIYDSAGVPLPFLGKPAPTLTSAAEIAARTEALIIPYFGIRGADGVSLRAVYEDPIAEGNAQDRTEELNTRLEAHVLRDPGQWFWIHRRWKPKRQAKRQRKAAAPKMGP